MMMKIYFYYHTFNNMVENGQKSQNFLMDVEVKTMSKIDLIV